jgi:hypothetical protein
MSAKDSGFFSNTKERLDGVALTSGQMHAELSEFLDTRGHLDASLDRRDGNKGSDFC